VAGAVIGPSVKERKREMTDRQQAPAGCRQSLTTAITVFVGFSLTFLRSLWFTEERSGWGWSGILGECIVVAGILLQVTALFRALDVDGDIGRYRLTVRLFQGGVLIAILGLLTSIFIGR
jgi:hypothetical protein